MNRRRATAIASTLAVLSLLAGMRIATASDPASSGTVSPPPTGETVEVSWTGTIPGGVNADSDCTASLDDGLNDHHEVELAIPRSFYRRHTLLATFTITPQPAVDDIILTVTEGGESLGSSDHGGVGSGEEVAVFNPAAGTLDAIACAFAGGPQPYTGTLTLTTDPLAVAGGFSPGAARSTYRAYAAPAGVGDDAGEPSLGVDWLANTASGGTVMYQAGLETLRVTIDAQGDAAWEDASAPWTSLISLDPILDIDEVNGRTFVSQLSGQDSLFAYSDDDGVSWTPGQGGGIPSGVDHQSVGNGPYPVNPLVGPLTAYPNAVYYCSQELATAFCARSDTGGLTFGLGVPIYTDECGGLHGHVRVSPDGTVYVPNKFCGGGQGVAVSRDAGMTWNVQVVPGSTPGGSDPSVAAGADDTLYFGYVDGDGHPKISVSSDHGTGWTTPVDVGAALGIENAVFPEVIAGDGDRAAFAFLGTTTPGNIEDPSFGVSDDGTHYVGGEWHLYVAITTDGGQTWSTVDATPKDPVQRGAICLMGVTCDSEVRNLLDFNDIDIDSAGRVLAAFADGCTGACVTSTAVSDNPHSAKASFVRQTGGAFLFG